MNPAPPAASSRREVRVGLVTEGHFPILGGMEIANHQLAQALDRQPDTRACVAATGPANLPRGFSYPYRHYRSRSLSVLTPYLRRRNVERMLKRERIDVLHGLMLHGGGARAVDAAERHGLPVVVGAQGADVQCVPEIAYGASLDPAASAEIRRVLARADRIVALSRLNREMLVELGADLERIVVIPNGVAWDAIGVVPREERRPQLGLSRDDFVLITVSRASPVKRMDLLYRALRIARRSAPFLRCVSVGPREPLVRVARDAGVEDAVVFTGPVVASDNPPAPELVHLQRAADLYVSVSYVESFGNAALEAAACGTPALLTPRHGVLDVLTEGEAAFVARDETPDGIARVLLDLASRRDKLAARRDSVRASVAYLTWDEIAARCREVYVSVLRSN